MLVLPVLLLEILQALRPLPFLVGLNRRGLFLLLFLLDRVLVVITLGCFVLNLDLFSYISFLTLHLFFIL